MVLYLIRMVRSVETKRMRGTKEKMRTKEKTSFWFLSLRFSSHVVFITLVRDLWTTGWQLLHVTMHVLWWRICIFASVNTKKYFLLQIISSLPGVRYDLLEIRFPVNMFSFQISSLPDIDQATVNNYNFILILKERDEEKRREVWECEGWVCEVESIGVSIMLRLVHSPETLVTMLPTWDLIVEHLFSLQRINRGMRGDEDRGRRCYARQSFKTWGDWKLSHTGWILRGLTAHGRSHG